MRGAAGLDDPREEVVQLRGYGAQADLLELTGQSLVRHGRWLSTCEFIVGFQIMRADIERLSLRMVAEIEAQRCRAGLAAQQESYRRRTWRVALQCFGDSSAQCGGAIQLQQSQELGDLGAARRSFLGAHNWASPVRRRSLRDLRCFAPDGVDSALGVIWTH